MVYVGGRKGIDYDKRFIFASSRWYGGYYKTILNALTVETQLALAA